MDFSAAQDSSEQQAFRREVKDWFEKNVPHDMKDPVDGRDFSKEQFLFWRGKHREMADKGWLFPTFPKEYGGGGLTGDHEVIINEEMQLAGAPGNFTNQFVFPALLVWGTEEQKQKFLTPLVKSEKTAWQKFTEPSSGADLANYASRAVRDGDDWLLSGQNVFVSGRGRPQWETEFPNYLFGPMMTDPDAPRHRNLGFFMVPVPSEGLVVQEQVLLNGHDQHAIFMDNVRVTGDHLIGGDHQGWQVSNTSLEQEHGGRGAAAPRDEAVSNLLEYVKNAKASDPVVEQQTMSTVLDSHRQRVLIQRTFWMYQERQEISYQGNLSNVHGRESSLRTASGVRDIMGMYSLLDRNEPATPFGGQQEVNQRSRAGQNHAGGSTGIAKVVLARRIGISRTQERAAPTPSTATKGGV
jgi:alkylation response protein AidB-like acyl-CoA dehydrogenase